jgi:hypothetical protein
MEVRAGACGGGPVVGAGAALGAEKVWPWRLHQVAGGNAGGELEWSVADALLDPVMGEAVTAALRCFGQSRNT